MKMLTRLASLLALPFILKAAQPWQEIMMPTVAEAAVAFPQPPNEYRAIHWSIWGGPQSKERIVADLDRIVASGGGAYMINNSRGLQPKYFTPEYLALVKFAVEECKKRGLKMWIEDEAGYPDGFAGGAISRDYPELGMQGIVADGRYSVAAGQTLKIPVPPDPLGVLAYNRSTRTSKALPIPASGLFQFTAPNPGLSEVVFVRHVYRSSPTRYTNREDGTADKDSLYSVFDYLDPAATRVYLKVIFETYEKLVGDEFGKTILGFRGDEPDYTGFMPWTPQLLEIFKKEKGYDLAPYIAEFFGTELSPEATRAKADYWDVWSALFRDNFFKPQQDWCKARGMEYMVHLNHEELMLDLARGEDLIRNEGSFFRAMRFVGVPGVDNLSQIGPGIVADFPKLAAAAAHVFGRPMVWTEAGGGLGQTGKFVADYQFVRGINSLNIRGLNNPAPIDSTPLLNAAAATGNYVSRASYLLTMGRPAAQVALFHPTDSLWLGDQAADAVNVKLTTQLMEHQIDFDAIDEDSLSTVCTLEGGTFKNLSGQIYRAVIVPTSTVISKKMLDRLRAFAGAGGKVVFVGRPPTMVRENSFLQATATPPDLSFATLEPQPDVTERVLAALPKADVKLDAACAPLKYIHRTLKDGDVYFFFNESNQTQSRTVTLDGTGQVQVWDATSGSIQALAGAVPAKGSVAVSLTFAPQESRFVVIGPLPAAAAQPALNAAVARTVAELSGEWSIALGEKQATSVLKPWSALSPQPFTGTAEYRKTFTLAATVSAAQRTYLDLGNVHDIARIRVNGTEFSARGWAPYLWDVTGALKSGENTLEVQVQPPVAAGTGFGGGAGRGQRPGVTAAGAPRAVLATGVPGGLASEPMPGGRGGGAAGAGPAGGPPTAPVVALAALGLLGPVRLLTP